MRPRQTRTDPLPAMWLLSDERNDAALDDALRRLAPGSGFVYRHRHLPSDLRRARYDALAAVARRQGHLVILASPCWDEASEWRSDGLYASPQAVSGTRPAGLLWLATAHNAAEIAAANRQGADGIFLSPVFPTRSHPGERGLGKDRFRQLALESRAPVIALGGMSAGRAAELGWPRWGAIDALA